MDWLAAERGMNVSARSKIAYSAPLGPSARVYANAAVVVETALEPLEMLDILQEIEARFGRQRRGRRWQARTLDLDIILWSGGIYSHPRLALPHPAFRTRPFVTGPAAAIARGWRDPLTGLTMARLHHRLTARRPRHRGRTRSGP